MEKIPEVENAKALMNEAMLWSVMKWLREKKTVRKAADIANASLDRSREAIRLRWPDAVQLAYRLLSANANGTSRPNGLDSAAQRLAKLVKDCDDAALRARIDAEETFDKAEKQLSTSLAREGCRKAIYSWELSEKAIRQAESVTAQK